ncbi:MAG: preprotein translocase subunit YajC [Simkaniaceae bacterium]|nr:preprotein translocase subunit YajC [Simkaniaceae bacterium]
MKKSLIFLLSTCTTGLLFADGVAAPARGGGMQQMLIMGGIAVAFFYFILLRPEQKRRKKMNELRKNLAKGDRVTLTSGIVGTVSQINETTVVLKTVDGSQIEALKGAIAEAGRDADGKGVSKATSISEGQPQKADS